MPDFEFTREMAQELAEAGSIQPPREAWEDLDYLYDAMGQINHKRFSLSMSFEEFSKTQKGTVILPVAKKIIEASFETDLEWDIAREMGYTLREEDCSWHPDPETSRGGFSVVFVKNPAKNERLVTGGRDFLRSRTSEKVYHYKNGPIVMCQEGFGHKLLAPDKPRLGTWHTGVRTKPSRFGVVDFIPS